MTSPITREDLMSLEDYARQRPEFRARVMEHKKNRKLHIGPHATLYFEDRLTMQYQIQEMLRAERIFELEGIEEELAAYNPLVPNGANWKATFMLEYSDIEQRRVALAQMIGIEDKVWVRVDGFDRIFAIADEDMERENEEKTSSVHFLRFELGSEAAAAVMNGAEVSAGIDHPAYNETVAPLPANIRDSLEGDLN